MICPTCGMDVPEGSLVCPTCGYHFVGATPEPTPEAQTEENTQENENAQLETTPESPAPAYGVPTDVIPTDVVPEKKSKTGLIIGIVAGVIVLAAIVVCIILFVFGNKTDGKYVCDVYAAFGIDVYLDVDGSDVSMVMEYDMDGDGEITEDEQEIEDGTIEFDGDVCTITIDGDSQEATYDSKEKTITISDDDYGLELVFTKED